MKKDEKRERILMAAESLLGEHRLHEVKLDDVAARAGVGKGTIYLYFKDKDDLVYHVALSGIKALCEELAEIRDTPDLTFEARLLSVCRRITAFFVERKTLIRMMQWEDYLKAGRKKSMMDTWADQRKGMVVAVANVLERGQREGLVRPDVPPDVLAEFLLGLLRTRAWKYARIPKEFCETEFVTNLFLYGGAADVSENAGANGRAAFTGSSTTGLNSIRDEK